MPLRSLPVLLAFLCLLTPARAVPADGLDALLAQAGRERLAQQRHWLNLLYYEDSGLTGGPARSAVDQAGFFLAPDGATDPAAELAATLRAFFEHRETGDAHALCRFPARFAWLDEQLQLRRHGLPEVECGERDAWLREVHAASATLVFPTYQLNSPSSMFGHTLLRLDRTGEGWSEWLSYAVNFGAMVEAGDNSLLYAFKGLSGGYPGRFAILPYYKKIQEYNRIERRDIWEYRLNLTPEEVGRLLDHLWELREVDFPYLFATKNCSYRLLNLLEVARPGVELTDAHRLTAIPVDTIRSVQQAGMVEQSRYRPSLETLTRQQLEQLQPGDRIWLERLMARPAPPPEAFGQLPMPHQRRLLDTAYRLVRLRQNRRARDPQAAELSHALLQAASRLPAAAQEAEVPVPPRPETGHESRRLQLGLAHRRNDQYLSLGYRLAFHSLEDNTRGYLPGAQINLGNLELRQKLETGQVVLQRLDLADITSFTPRDRYFKPLSWRVLGGLERVFSDDDDRLAGQVSGGGGFAWSLAGRATLYSLLTARLEANGGFDHFLQPAGGAAVGTLYQGWPGTGRIEFRGWQFTGGEYRINGEWQQNIRLARNHALRLAVTREWHPDGNFFDAGLSYHYHF